jgi:hypothetical protein
LSKRTIEHRPQELIFFTALIHFVSLPFLVHVSFSGVSVISTRSLGTKFSADELLEGLGGFRDVPLNYSLPTLAAFNETFCVSIPKELHSVTPSSRLPRREISLFDFSIATASWTVRVVRKIQNKHLIIPQLLLILDRLQDMYSWLRAT